MVSSVFKRHHHRLIKTQIGHARDFAWYRGQRPSPACVILSHERVQIHAHENLCSYATNPPHFCVRELLLCDILITRAGDGCWPRYQAKSLACPGCGHHISFNFLHFNLSTQHFSWEQASKCPHFPTMWVTRNMDRRLKYQSEAQKVSHKLSCTETLLNYIPLNSFGYLQIPNISQVWISQFSHMLVMRKVDKEASACKTCHTCICYFAKRHSKIDPSFLYGALSLSLTTVCLQNSD